MTKVLETFNEKETYSLGKTLGESAVPGEVICLDGDLGVGKTVFAQGFAEGLENGNPEALRKAEELAETARNALGGRLDLLDINAAYAPSQARILTDYSVTHTHDFQQSSEIRALRNDIGTLSANIRELADRPIDVYVDKNKLVGGTIGEIDRQLASVEFFKNRGV